MLVYGSYSDVRTREVSDVVWVVMAVFGVFFACVELHMGSLSLFQLFKSVIVGAIFAFLLYILNFGGADVKAIISLSLLFPNSPFFSAFHLSLPLRGVPPLDIFVLSMLTNTLLIAISAPFSLFLYNLFRRNFSPLMFLGYKGEIFQLRKKKNYKLMHEIEEEESKKLKYIWGA
jgi:preflagellin peptidase FlaK